MSNHNEQPLSPLEIELSDAQSKQQQDLARAQSLQPKHRPLVEHIYTADPSAHVFDGKIYIYPSHDIQTDAEINDNGEQFAMRDYHVLSLDRDTFEATDHGVALSVEDVPWAQMQMWAPDATRKNGRYYFYFPARAYDGIFRIGVAVSDSPTGPFTAQDNYIEGTYSIDPAVFADDDGSYYLYWGGIWGGQLQNWRDGQFHPRDIYPADDQPAYAPLVAKLSDDMLSLAESPKDILIYDENGKLLRAGDNQRRFFEASWLHKHNQQYYFSYSTGDTHKIVYATGKSPYGPFTYQGVILNPVLGWTNHHSIVQYNNKWFLFYHDSTLSGGQTHLRCVKMSELIHDSEGKILPLQAYE
ncbi:glycoside hydrolase family 43 protein [Aliiglaciecola lipolytica]|uniref:glycoside hydrolase family 43 protein n=1 Tax=Aliiglaciecola lipolytica TaxID=477689 RepID=UPI001C09D690|nr:glycoside hydrolase family 43 protein [Aliiglaciecola lipolytica]MBU2876821.1 glycoside hydrolase family 43 protein [Aliiglaciecola lipolytica]